MDTIKTALMCGTAQPAPSMRSTSSANTSTATPRRGSAHQDRQRGRAAARQRPRQHRKQDAGTDDDGNAPDGSDAPDELVPAPKVWKDLGVCSMTGWRWTHDPKLAFPPAIKINTRNYRSRKQLEAFKARLLRTAMRASRPGAPAGAR
jgi:hypothetical protein